ncbi:MAG TPA: hypothetical protein PKD52_05250 [Clostridiales bacterium]|nr:hypothetical protein [Clostridiales bacterium]
MMKSVKLFDYDEMEATDFYCRYTGLKEGAERDLYKQRRMGYDENLRKV